MSNTVNSWWLIGLCGKDMSLNLGNFWLCRRKRIWDRVVVEGRVVIKDFWKIDVEVCIIWCCAWRLQRFNDLWSLGLQR